ncbi:hypothetical protein CB1_000061020 [Camelus ferus]|nr:hypothetical protein CB1_000061020 [Camelus ferus]
MLMPEAKLTQPDADLVAQRPRLEESPPQRQPCPRVEQAGRQGSGPHSQALGTAVRAEQQQGEGPPEAIQVNRFPENFLYSRGENMPDLWHQADLFRAS